MDERTRVLEHIATLAREHHLTAAEIAAALAADQPAPEPATRARSLVVRALGYLGGTFVFAGIAAFIALQWNEMNSAARVIITLGPGIAACVLAVLSSRDEGTPFRRSGSQVRFDKAAAPLFLMAAVLEPTGLLVAFKEFGSGGDARWAALVTAGVIALQFGVIFSVLRQSMLLFLGVFFATLFWLTCFDLLNMDNGIAALATGSSLLLSAIGVDRTRHGVITPSWYFFGAIGVLYGLFDLVERTPFEIVFILVASGFVYLSAAVQSRTLLVVATAAILAYTGWFTGQHFADSLGWPLALMLFGMIMIGLSALAFRIDRQFIRNR
jgi:hypothetical protein